MIINFSKSKQREKVKTYRYDFDEGMSVKVSDVRR